MAKASGETRIRDKAEWPDGVADDENETRRLAQDAGDDEKMANSCQTSGDDSEDLEKKLGREEWGKLGYSIQAIYNKLIYELETPAREALGSYDWETKWEKKSERLPSRRRKGGISGNACGYCGRQQR